MCGESFLSKCGLCGKLLQQGSDLFQYSGGGGSVDPDRL
ncbi:MAG: hypothetical protein IJ147_10590 [Lachnospiraceae bacterium]|nr:hypothetical protein [Lachnospiraceae bacterium]MBQ8118487.1 hypothetical protein [Lachnospiraceae bacterium]